MASVQPRLLQILDITAYAASLLGTDKLKLFQAPTVVGPLTKLSDLVECDFAGYAPFTLTAVWLDALDALGDGLAKYNGLVPFQAIGIVATQIAAGAYIVDTTGVDLKAAWNFDSPITFANENDTLLLTPFLYALFQANSDDEFLPGA